MHRIISPVNGSVNGAGSAVNGGSAAWSTRLRLNGSAWSAAQADWADTWLTRGLSVGHVAMTWQDDVALTRCWRGADVGPRGSSSSWRRACGAWVRLGSRAGKLNGACGSVPRVGLTRRVLGAQSVANSTYIVIDWESLLIVPKHVAFKGNNGNYLSACWIKGHPYLHFSSSDIGDHTVGNEVITTPNGSIRIKSDHLRKFWRCNNNWILADSDDSTSNNSYTSSSCNFLTRFFCCQSKEGRKQKQKQKQKQENKSPEYDMFWPIKVDNNVVALRNLGNKKFWKILTADGKTNCLSAAASRISSEVHLKAEEAVISRKIYNVNFRLGDARIYNKSILTLATEDAINRTQEPKTIDVKLSYSESRTWNSSVSLKLLGVKTTIQTTVPLISAEGKSELSGEFSGDYQWGESLTTHEEKVYKASVPPMTMVRVNLIATMASCDIPFSYEQLDTTTLTSIQQITETMDDGIYTGSNCFNCNCETEQEKL
ncbi:hypothetical protein HYC85_004092 [Camellia sinensis]|uniref:Agglutinin domain-containing protein n=1 Tax=Camellia sinensis TaxID=4442 RepID=A0A7J7HWS6_CAMSI|nr:hypothetical protein HYC85_004092 [Camellia sinensis]